MVTCSSSCMSRYCIILFKLQCAFGIASLSCTGYSKAPLVGHSLRLLWESGYGAPYVS